MEGQEKPHSCPMTLDEHVLLLINAMMALGMGGGCINTYRALVEVADYVKNEFAQEGYQPTGLVRRMEDEAKMLRLAQAGSPSDRTH